MTAEGPEEQPPSPTPVVPPDLRLRGERPRVTRLSRKVLIGLGAVSALAVAGALGYALQTRNAAQTGQELLSTQNRPSAEGLAGLPKDYTGLPRQAPPLGPPLPGVTHVDYGDLEAVKGAMLTAIRRTLNRDVTVGL